MTETNIISGDTILDSKKKGRKPKQKNYFDVQEELAVVDYLTAETSEEKNKFIMISSEFH